MLRQSILCCVLMSFLAVAASAQAPPPPWERTTTDASDLMDEILLRRTLYGMVTVESISEEETAEMIAAAERRVARRRDRLEQTQTLVNEGLVARNALKALEDEIREHEQTLELARARASLLEGIAAMARLEIETARLEESQPELLPVRERFDGAGRFTRDQLRQVVLAFEKEFGRPLPISAHGDTPFHRSMGFDHSGRVDVALTPDQAEGVWLRRYLESVNIPYYAFRSFVPGASTGAHIHIGPPSLRLRVAD
jgi:hypothetical protein